MYRDARLRVLHRPQEGESADLPPHLPPLNHVRTLVDRSQIRGRRFVLPRSDVQLLRARPHVRLLLSCRPRACVQKASLVEKISHYHSGFNLYSYLKWVELKNDLKN